MPLDGHFHLRIAAEGEGIVGIVGQDGMIDRLVRKVLLPVFPPLALGLGEVGLNALTFDGLSARLTLGLDPLTQRLGELLGRRGGRSLGGLERSRLLFLGREFDPAREPEEIEQHHRQPGPDFEWNCLHSFPSKVVS